MASAVLILTFFILRGISCLPTSQADLDKRASFSNPTTVGSFQNDGCWTDVPRRVLASASMSSNSMTLNQCASFCSGYTLFGTESGTECYCGNSFSGSTSQIAASQCNNACAGSPSQSCGGPWRLNLYKKGSTSSSSVSSSSSKSASTTPSTIKGMATSTSTSLASNSSSSSSHSQTITTLTSSIGTLTTSPSSNKSTSSLSSSSYLTIFSPTSNNPSSTQNSTSSVPPSSTIKSSTSSSSVVSSTSSASITSTSSSASASATAGPKKRGLAYNDASYTTLFNGPNSQISWGYDWGQTAGSGFYSSYEFVPMLWNNATSATSTWKANVEAALASGTTHLLAFNEPDYSEQANMSPAVAAQAYMQWMQPYAGRAKLGAPAVTNGGAPMGLTWLAEFMGNCTSCTIDFVPFHWYDSASNYYYFKAYVEEVYAQVQKPLWITEFNGSGSLDEQVAFLQLVVPWLDSLSYMERYAWFYDAVGYMLTDSTDLNEVGVAFMNYTSSTVNPYFTS